MASPVAPTLILIICVFVAQVSSQLDCPTGPRSTVPESTTLSDTVHLLWTESSEEARDTALCHVACSNYAFIDMGNSTNASISDEPVSVDRAII